MRAILTIILVFYLKHTFAAETQSTPPPGYITVCQDNSLIENEIYSYIRHVHKLTGEKKYDKETRDTYLLYKIKQPDSETRNIYINVKPGLIEKGRITASTIEIYTYQELPAQLMSNTAFNALLAYNSTFMLETWFSPTIYVHDKRVIVFKNIIYIPSPDTWIPIKTIYDTMIRSVSCCQFYLKELKHKFKLTIDNGSIRKIEDISRDRKI